MKKKFLNLCVISSLALLVSGCATKIPVEKQVGQLNLQTINIKQEPSTNKTLGIVEPEFHYQTTQNKVQTQYSQNPLLAQFMAAKMQQTTFSPTQYFQKSYQNRLKQALETSIENILIKKGFKLKGPYNSFDDITYQDKKEIYLAVIPKVNLDIKKVVTFRKCENLYCTEKGKIYFGGNVIITLEEPLTRQIFMKKRINLSDANIEENFIYQHQISTKTGDLTADLINKATAPAKLVDNTDKVMVDGINKFYIYAVKKLNTYLNREELLSYSKDVEKLKSLKRF